MATAAHDGGTDGGCVVRLHVFESPSAELMHRLESGDVTLSAAIVALRAELSHRLDLLAFVVSGLEELGWGIRLEGQDIVATAALSPEAAREQLEDRGITGPMCVVADLDGTGWPVIQSLDASPVTP